MSHASSLGQAFRAARREQGLSQQGAADRAALVVSTVRTIEGGRGRLDSAGQLLTALGMELRGRSLPAGAIGPALAALRTRCGISQRHAARASRVSRNTLAGIERGTGLLATLEAYGALLGAGLHLAAVDAPRRFYAHSGNASTFHGWETPADLAAQLTAAVQGFDLDPCAATADRRRARIKARHLITAEADGLASPWLGKVFVNPPYGRSLAHWVEKAAASAATGRAVVVALVPARTDTKWWHAHVAGQAHAFLLKGRLRFGDGAEAAPFPSAVVAWGAPAITVDRLRAVLPSAWHIPVAFSGTEL